MKFSAIISDGSRPCATAVLQGPLSQTLADAAQLGYDGVQLTVRTPSDVPLKTLCPLLAQEHLVVTALATGQIYTVDGLSMGSGDETNRKQSVARLCQLAELAAALGGASLILGACRGRTQDAPTPACYFAQLEKSVRELMACAEPLQVPVIFEVIDHLESDAFYKLDETQAFVERIGSPYFRLYLDTMHLLYEQEDIPAVLRRFGGDLIQLDISGEGRRCPMDSKIDFAAAISALRDSGFDGTLAFELDPGSHPDAARASLRYIRSLF